MSIFPFPMHRITTLFPNQLKLLKIVLFLIISGLSLTGSPWLPSSKATEPSDNKLINCDIQKTACTQPLGKGTVTLDILPKPVKAMADLTFHLTLKDIVPPEIPFIDLGMPGMKMGPNRVQLKNTEDGKGYTGTGIIVRCPSGRTIWKALVTIPGAGSVEYVFNVIY
jgi:hypothetical protein